MFQRTTLALGLFAALAVSCSTTQHSPMSALESAAPGATADYIVACAADLVEVETAPNGPPGMEAVEVSYDSLKSLANILYKTAYRYENTDHDAALGKFLTHIERRKVPNGTASIWELKDPNGRSVMFVPVAHPSIPTGKYWHFSGEKARIHAVLKGTETTIDRDSWAVRLPYAKEGMKILMLSAPVLALMDPS